jgi:hypothetical protein
MIMSLEEFLAENSAYEDDIKKMIKEHPENTKFTVVMSEEKITLIPQGKTKIVFSEFSLPELFCVDKKGKEMLLPPRNRLKGKLRGIG